jgi:hypothetical protein
MKRNNYLFVREKVAQWGAIVWPRFSQGIEERYGIDR